jgi:hypothetical protein
VRDSKVKIFALKDVVRFMTGEQIIVRSLLLLKIGPAASQRKSPLLTIQAGR